MFDVTDNGLRLGTINLISAKKNVGKPMTKIAMVEVESCNDCPHFDNEYYTYNRECVLLNRCINSDRYGIHNIPKDCPLEDKGENCDENCDS